MYCGEKTLLQAINKRAATRKNTIVVGAFHPPAKKWNTAQASAKTMVATMSHDEISIAVSVPGPAISKLFEGA